MGNIPSEMKSLCEDIATAHEERKRSVKDLREQVESIRDNARKFVSDCKKLHKEMARDLQNGLAKNREELIKNVNTLREDFRKKEMETRAELAEASKIWSKLQETLKSKKYQKRGEKND